MDFRQTSQTSNNRQEHAQASTGTKPAVRVSDNNTLSNTGWLTWLKGLVLLGALFLLLASGIALLKGGNVVKEGGLVDTSRYQAVFLNSQDGQVYFGKLGVYNNDLYVLTDIYYVRVENPVQPEGTNQAASKANISLAKLGNELHGPEDTMYISRDKVLFWENLKDDGQVAKAISDYKKNGEKSTTDTTNTTTPTNTTTTQP
jgi:hypothetical protein